MKHDLNPRWTTTGSTQNDGGNDAEPALDTRDEWAAPIANGNEPTRSRISVERNWNFRRGMIRSLAGVCSVFVLGFVFLQGTLFLRASLIEDGAPDHIIVLTEQGFESVEVLPGDTVEFRNSMATAEEYRSENTDPITRAPLITTSAIAPGASIRISIPANLSEEEITFISSFLPSRRGTIIMNAKEPESDAEAPAKENELPVADLPLPTLTEVRAVPTLADSPRVQGNSSAAVTALPEHPLPSQATSAAPDEILHLDMTRSNPLPLSWPSILRTNRFTVGSPLVPDLSHAVSVRRSTGNAHRAAGEGDINVSPVQARYAPATGPELGFLFILSLAIVPVFLIRRRT
ncbi:MAG TPA: hypothetical protein VJB82_05175 [Candidatus Peribacterales bacterium]|nr:hypothetical protein [Candidatus Peribacterales bacterium]